jgi:hypothetical protein
MSDSSNLEFLSWSSIKDSVGRKVSSYTLDLADPGLTAVREHLWNAAASIIWGFFMFAATLAANILRWVGDPVFLDSLSDFYKRITAQTFQSINPLLIGVLAFTVMVLFIMIDTYKDKELAGGKVVGTNTFNRVGSGIVILFGIALLTFNPFAILKGLLSVANTLISAIAGDKAGVAGAVSVDFLIRQPTLLITYNGAVSDACAEQWSRGVDIAKVSGCVAEGSNNATVSTVFVAVIAVLMSVAALAFGVLAIWKFAKHLTVSILGFISLGWVAAVSMVQRRQFDTLGQAIAVSAGHMIMAIIVQVVSIGGPTLVMGLMSGWGQNRQPILQMMVLTVSYLVLFAVLQNMTSRTGILVRALKADSSGLLKKTMGAPRWVSSAPEETKGAAGVARSPAPENPKGAAGVALGQAIRDKAAKNAFLDVADKAGVSGDTIMDRVDVPGWITTDPAAGGGEPTQVVADTAQPIHVVAPAAQQPATGEQLALPMDLPGRQGTLFDDDPESPFAGEGESSALAVGSPSRGQVGEQEESTPVSRRRLRAVPDPPAEAADPASSEQQTPPFDTPENLDAQYAQLAEDSRPAVDDVAALVAAIREASRNSPNPYVGGRTPITVVKDSAQRVAGYMNQRWEGRESPEPEDRVEYAESSDMGEPYRGRVKRTADKARGRLDKRFADPADKNLILMSAGPGLLIKSYSKAAISEGAKRANAAVKAKFPTYRKTTDVSSYAAWRLLGGSATRGDVTVTKQSQVVESADNQSVLENEVRKRQAQGKNGRAYYPIEDTSQNLLFDGSDPNNPVAQREGFNKSLA